MPKRGRVGRGLVGEVPDPGNARVRLRHRRPRRREDRRDSQQRDAGEECTARTTSHARSLSNGRGNWYDPPVAQGLRELVGRVMIDPEFLAELQRTPAPLLAEYELSDAERATVDQALVRLAKTPSSQRRHEFRSSLISRVAT